VRSEAVSHTRSLFVYNQLRPAVINNMTRKSRRSSCFIAIVASIVAVTFADNWRAVWSAGISARQAREARSQVLDSKANADKDVRAPSGRSMPALQALANLPLAFEVNQGQMDRRIKFLARTAGGELQLSEDSVRLQFKRSALSFRFDGAHATPGVIGNGPLVERRNFLLGNDPSKWHTDVPTFRRVAYEQLYSGIDLTFYGNQKQIEYDFEVAPGADPRAIRLAFDHNVQARISPDGDLIIKSRGIELIQRKPAIYQTINGQRHTIEGRYKLLGDHKMGFEVAEYDHAKPLVIDPTLVYSTYLGGSGDDSGNSIATDSSGNVYVAGTTASMNFPAQTPAFVTSKALEDIFITKIDAAGANVLYSTYIGGSGRDRAGAIAIDSSGNAYVGGRVDSTSTNFPTTPGSLASSYRGGDFDGVVFKLNAQGNQLIYSTFFGGEENDSVEGIAVDAGGTAYVTGGTKSNAFPTTVSAYQGTRAGDTDAFLAKINQAGSALLYSSYLGGAATDRGSGVVIDGTGLAYIAGYGASPDFPTQDPFQAGFGGSFDAFVAKFDTNASGINSLSFCSYLGGAGDDKAFGIAMDGSQTNLYVVGQTSSNNFPVLNPVQPSSGGSFDAFIAKVSTSGTKVFATYFGGSGDDRGTGIAVNASGAYVTGFTSSPNLPTVTPLQLNNGGSFDAFVAKLNLTGSSILYSTYLGGTANENFVVAVTGTNPIAVDSSNAYLTGYTSSTNFPTAAPLQAANAGSQDVFIAKIADATPASDFSLSASPLSRTINPADATTYTVTATPAGGFTGNISLSVNGASNDTTTGFSPTSISITDASARSSTLTVTTTSSTPPGAYTLTITATSGNLQHSTSVQLIVSGPTSANLSLTKTASPNPGVTLANLTYRLTVMNNGPSPATNVVVTDNLPIGINFTSATPTQGMCSGTTTVTCNLGSLARNALAVVNIIVVPQSAGTLTNTASVAATENDPDGSDNSVSLQTTINTPASGPSLTDPNLSVRTVVTGLSQPTSMAFIGNNDFFIFEKNTGRVQRVINGVIQSPPPLDLAVNSGSERGGLGIALHPNFAFNGYVYLYWTESSTGVDTTNLAEVPTLGNRVDRYVWNGSALTFDRNLIKLRAYQADANQQLRGNHNGGVLRFGPDGKLYILMGDNGRRGLLQNLPCGPTATCPPTVTDDQFGGPDPDNNHLTGFILRLNDDGTTPADNPFVNYVSVLPSESLTNIRKLYAYGVRNGFGLGFDPYSGYLWDQENGDDAFDEMNRVTAGSNNGWIQMMGPMSRVAQFKQIETTYGSGDLQQLRWSPQNIQSTPAAALASLFMLTGAHYNDPEFSWKYAIPASPLGFVQGRGLGPQFEGDMFVGAARTFLAGGFLFRFRLTQDRQHFAFTDSRLNDLVADNDDKFDIKESESLLIGRDFGITTDIQTAPNGNLFVVSNSNSAVYEISGRQPALYVANLTGAQETPPNNSPGVGTATLLLSPDETSARVSLNFSGLTSGETDAHIHGPGAAGVIAPILFPLPSGNFSDFQISLTPTDLSHLKDGLLYINVHTTNFPNGEIRGQFGSSSSSSSVQFSAANYRVSESSGRATVTVTRLGDISAAATVNYTTSDTAGAAPCNTINGQASARCDYATTIGRLSFAPGETFKTINVAVTDDHYAEGDENFSVALISATGAALGSPNLATVTITDNESTGGPPNPIDSSDFFIYQHYVDFLNRYPDPSGFAFWTSTITSCGADAACTEVKRINASAAFFLSIEFNQTGFLAYLTNRVAFGNMTAPNAPVPLTYNQFINDAQALQKNYVFGAPGADAQLEANKQAYFDEFVTRPAFVAKYGGLSNLNYVDTLLATGGVNSTTAELYITKLTGAQVVPPTNSTASGLMIFRQALDGHSAAMSLSLNDLSSPETAAHIHSPAVATATAPAIVTLPNGQFTSFQMPLTPAQANDLGGGLFYVDVHTNNFPNGEIRGQFPQNLFVRDMILNALNAGTITRAQALRLIAESEGLRQKEFNRAFVLMEYFGYLRRDPDAAGYDFWLTKLNNFNGDFVKAEMVKAFLSSLEYRQRFGAP
jgi:aldose sugar dehydrogenase